MKKTLIALTAALALTACTRETVYYVDSTTTTTEAKKETAKTTTTTETRRTVTTQYRGFSSIEEEYLWSVESLYDSTIYLTDDELIGMGWSICDTLDAGVTLETMVYNFTVEINKTAYPYDSASFVSSVIASALGSLCPWHSWQLN